MPLLKPIFVILTSLSIIWDFQVFQQIWIMLDQRPTADYYTMAIYAFVAVVPAERVRARLFDRRRDGHVHVRRDARLHPADAEGGRGAVSSGTQIAPTPVAPVTPRRSRRRRMHKPAGTCSGCSCSS